MYILREILISVSPPPSPPPHACLRLLCMGKVQNVLPQPSSLRQPGPPLMFVLQSLLKNMTQQAAVLPQAANKSSPDQNCLLHHCSESQKKLHFGTALTLFPPPFPTALTLWRKGGQQQAHKLQHGNPLHLSNNTSFVPTAWEVHAFPLLMLVMAWNLWGLSMIKMPFFSTTSFLDYWTSKWDMGLLPFLGVDTDGYGGGKWRCHLGSGGGHF